MSGTSAGAGTLRAAQSESQTPTGEPTCVVLLHGLARSAGSMGKLAESLQQAGYLVANIDYPSRKQKVPQLAATAVPAGVRKCTEAGAKSISFVTHSMGGILVRYYLSQNTIDGLHRVVMLAPPNQGSQVVDEMKSIPGFKLLNGPAGIQLGTDSSGIPAQLGPVDFDLGVIAGTRSINLILSSVLPNPDDGKVSVENTKVDGMCWFLALAVSHPFIMKNQSVIQQVLTYLENGRFTANQAMQFECPAASL